MTSLADAVGRGVKGEALARVDARVTEAITEGLVADARRRAAQGLPSLAEAARRAFAAKLVAAELERLTREQLAHGLEPLSEAGEAELARRVLDAYFGAGRFQPLLALPDVTDVMVNNYDTIWLDHSDGRRTRYTERVFASNQEVIEEVARLARSSGRTERRFDAGKPRLVLRLPDGARLAAIMEVSGAPNVAIRRNVLQSATLADLYARRMIGRELLSMLPAAMRGGFRVMVSGETGAGKTTLLRGMVNELPTDARVIVIEDTKELDLSCDPARAASVLEWETREPNVEGEGEITIRDLVKDALRFNPDYLVVAEVRDGAAAREMMMAMQHGHPSLSTIHHHSAFGAPLKLAQYLSQGTEPMPFEIAQLVIAESVDLFIHLDRATDGTRVVAEVCETAGWEAGKVQLNRILTRGPDGRGRPQAHMTDHRLRRLIAHGFDDSLLHSSQWGL